MSPKEIPELRGNGTGDHEVVNGQQLIYPDIEPLGRLFALAGLTITVAVCRFAARSENPI